MSVLVTRLNFEDSWQRCSLCGKRKVVLMASPGEPDPADLHTCLSCDNPPESIWLDPRRT